MTQTKCYFVGDKNPFQPIIMEPPRVGDKLFVEGEMRVWMVTGVQYQFYREGDLVLLKLVNVILEYHPF